jgi:hypothetical protein
MPRANTKASGLLMICQVADLGLLRQRQWDFEMRGRLPADE